MGSGKVTPGKQNHKMSLGEFFRTTSNPKETLRQLRSGGVTPSKKSAQEALQANMQQYVFKCSNIVGLRHITSIDHVP